MEVVDRPSTRVFICGISRRQTRYNIQNYFQRYDNNMLILFRPEDEHSQDFVNWSFAYAYFKDNAAARRVVKIGQHKIGGEIVECCMATDTNRIESLRLVQSTVVVGGFTENHSEGDDILKYFRNIGGSIRRWVFNWRLGYAAFVFTSLRSTRDIVERRFHQACGENLECVPLFDTNQVENLIIPQSTVFMRLARNHTREVIYQYFKNFGWVTKCHFSEDDRFARVTFKSVEVARQVVHQRIHQIAGEDVDCTLNQSREQRDFERLLQFQYNTFGN